MIGQGIQYKPFQLASFFSKDKGVLDELPFKTQGRGWLRNRTAELVKCSDFPLRLTDLLEPIIDLSTNPDVMETPLITKSTLTMSGWTPQMFLDHILGVCRHPARPQKHRGKCCRDPPCPRSRVQPEMCRSQETARQLCTRTAPQAHERH